jgi:SAM-dependent methyltransferase
VGHDPIVYGKKSSPQSKIGTLLKIGMQSKTIVQLNALNKQFYDGQASSWAESRQYFWPSWNTFLKESSLKAKKTISVLDLGCGTGRFARFVQQQWPQAQYWGIDNSSALLAQASHQDSHLPDERYEQKDIVAQLLNQEPLSSQKYDLITAFGVLHHVPSQNLREQFLREISQALNPGGECWLTIWLPHQLGWKPPAQKSWESVATQLGLDPADHEEGDSFLGWKKTDAVRYVHWLQDEEQASLLSISGLTLVQQWPEMSQGERGNLCWLLRADTN